MKSQKTKISGPDRNSGFAILIVVVAIAIVLMLYAMQFSVFFPSASHPEGKDRKPWEEESRLWDPNFPPPTLKFPNKKIKPKRDMYLTGPVDLAEAVESRDLQRGEISLYITPSGLVDGTWDCEYSHSDISYVIKADFAGNIDPSRTYIIRKKEKDPKPLYFFTKGRYTKTAHDSSTKKKETTSGPVYVTGFLLSQDEAEGKIIMTSDDKTWTALHTFFATP